MKLLVRTLRYFFYPEVSEIAIQKFKDVNGMYVTLQMHLPFSRKVTIDDKRVPKTNFYVITEFSESLKLKVYGIFRSKEYLIPVPQRFTEINFPKAAINAFHLHISKPVNRTVLRKNTLSIKNYHYLNVSIGDVKVRRQILGLKPPGLFLSDLNIDLGVDDKMIPKYITNQKEQCNE